MTYEYNFSFYHLFCMIKYIFNNCFKQNGYDYHRRVNLFHNYSTPDSLSLWESLHQQFRKFWRR